MHQMDQLLALIAVAAGLAGAVALWFFGNADRERIRT